MVSVLCDSIFNRFEMDASDWDIELLDLNLGCQNIFDEISLDFLNVADGKTEDNFYELKSKNVARSKVPP